MLPSRTPLIICKPSILFAQAPLTPDTLVINARIWTANEKQPWAQAMALAGDRIVRVGTTADINRLYNTGVSRDLRIIDAAKLGGKIIVPGFHDCHIHLMLGGNSLMEVQVERKKGREKKDKRKK